MAYTTSDLIASVKARAMIPDASSASFSSATILVLATEEFHITLVPAILAAREHYYETYVDLPIVAGQAYYPIPTRAIGGLLTGVQYVLPNSIQKLNQTDATAVDISISSNSPTSYYFENNNLVLYPNQNTSNGILRLRYFQRPSRLEQTSNCAQVTSFDSVAKTITVGSVPSSWTAGTIVDFIPQIVPFKPYSLNTVLTGVSSNVISVSSLPTSLAVGDWIALAEYTPCIELPVEFQAVLAQATATKVLEAAGDQQNAAISQQKLSTYVNNALRLITPRDQKGTKKVVSNWRNY